MSTLNKLLWTEIQKLKVAVARLKRRYGNECELIFMGSVYDSRGECQKSFDLVGVNVLTNYDSYINLLRLSYQRDFEKDRFRYFMKLGEFRVICVNDNMSDANKAFFEKEKADWIRNGETYIVTKITETIDGLMLSLRTVDGKVLNCPVPYEGYNSIRFRIEDYTKLN